jgi:hypothetical protein
MLAALFTLVVAWVAFAVIVGVMASARGRVGYGWFLFSLVLSPLITGLLVLALPRHHTQPQTVTVGAILKRFGITILSGILYGCVVVVGMFVLALFLIVQHGGG